jgi:hypothetical protein
VLRYTKSWSMGTATELPLLGLTAATAEANPSGSLYRLVFTYRDGTQRPLTEDFSYGADHHAEVARELTAGIVAAANASAR